MEGICVISEALLNGWLKLMSFPAFFDFDGCGRSSCR